MRGAIPAARAIAPVVLALAGAGGAGARGEVKTFSATESDWLSAINWTPAGVPTASDDVLINAGTVDMGLSSSLTVGRIVYTNVDNRVLANDTSGATDALLTIIGGIDLSQPGAGTFTIRGDNNSASGSGTGRLGLQIASSQTWSVAAGSTLDVSAGIGESGGSRSLTMDGAGTLVLSGTSTYSGSTRITGVPAGTKVVILTGAEARLVNTSSIQIDSGATFRVDLSSAGGAGGAADMINDAAVIRLGGTIEFMNASPVSVSETLGALKIDREVAKLQATDSHLTFARINPVTYGSLDLTLGGGASVAFAERAPLLHGILGTTITLNAEELATLNSSNEVVAFTAYNTAASSTSWNAGDNVDATGDVTISGRGVPNFIRLRKNDSTPGTVAMTAGSSLETNGLLVKGNWTISSGGELRAARSENIDLRAQLGVKVVGSSDRLTVSSLWDSRSQVWNALKWGAGTLVVDADNSGFTGDTVVGEGTLQLSAAGQLGLSTIDLNRDGRLDVVVGAKTIGGLSGSGAVTLGTGALSIGNNNGSTTFSGVISGGGGITKIGSGTLTLDCDNNYSGTTTIADGTLEIRRFSSLGSSTNVVIMGDSDGDLRLADGVTLSSQQITLVGGPGGGGGGGAGISVAREGLAIVNVGINETLPDTTLHVNRNGGGTLALGGNNTFTGGVTISGGTLRLGGLESQFGQLSGTSSVTIENGATLKIDNTVAQINDRIHDSATINMRGGRLVLVSGTVGAPSVTEVMGGLHLSRQGGGGDHRIDATQGQMDVRFGYLDRDSDDDGILDIRLASGNNVFFTSPPAMSNGILPGVVLNGTNWARIAQATGRVVPFSAYETTDDTSLWLSTDNVLVDGTRALVGDTDVNTLKLLNTATINNNGWRLGTSGILVAGGNSTLSGSGSITVKSSQIGSQEVTAYVNTGSSLTVSTPISGAGVSLVKSGEGTMVLDAACTFTGDVYVNNGTLELGANAQTGSSSINLDDDGITIYNAPGAKSVGGLSGSGSVVLGTGTLSIGSNDRSTTFSGTISSSSGGSIQKVGTGTLTLEAAPNFNGELHVSSGRTRIDQLETRLQALGLLGAVRLGSSGGAGAAPTQGALELSQTGYTRIDCPIILETGGGEIAVTGGGWVRATGSVSGSGALIITGTDTVGNAGQLSATGTLYTQNELEFTGSNTYTGATILDGGRLHLAGGGALTGTSSITVSAKGTAPAYLWVDNGDLGFVADRISDSAGIVLEGGKLRYSGGTTAGVEQVGQLALRKGWDGCIYGNKRTSGGSGLRFASLVREEGAALDLIQTVLSPDVDLMDVSFGSSPPVVDGILGGWLTVNRRDWGTLDSSGKIVAYSGYETSPNSLVWSPHSNVRLDQNVVITNPTEVNTFVLDGTRSHDDEVVKTLRTNAFLVTGTSTVTISGAGSLTTRSGNQELNIYTADPSSSPNLRLAIPIHDNGNSVSLVKSGEGTLLLDAPCTYTGTTYINSGTLRTGQFASLIDSALNLSDDARLELGGDFATGGASGGGSVDLADFKWSIISSPAPATLSGRISGTSGSLVKGGSGSLTLTGVSTYGGDTIVQDGTLVIASGAALTNTRKLGVANGGVEIAGAGNAINENASVEMSHGRIKILHGSTSNISQQRLGALHVVDGMNTIELVSPPGGASSLTFGSLSSSDRGGNANWIFEGGGSISFTASPPMSDGIIGAWARANTYNWACVNPDGTVAAYSAYHASNDPGTWLSIDNVLVDGASPVLVSSSRTINTLKLDGSGGGGGGVGGASLALSSSAVVSVDGILSIGDNTISGAGAIKPKTPGAYEFQLVVTDSTNLGGRLTIGSSIVDDGTNPVSIVKTGPGELVLSGNNTYTGATKVREGLLSYFQNGSIPTQEDFQISKGATINLNGHQVTVHRLSGDGTLSLGLGGNLTLDQATDSTFHVMSGDGHVIKTGAGTLRLEGTSTATGDLTIDGGTVVIGGAAGYVSQERIKLRQGIKVEIGGRMPPGGRINDIATIEMEGGTFEFESSGSGGTETVGQLQMRKGWDGTIKGRALWGLGGNLNLSSITREEGSTLNLDLDAGSRVTCTTPPGQSNGIVGGWLVVNETNWTKANTDDSFEAFTDYLTVNDPNTFTATSNGRYLLRAGVPLRFDTTVNSLKLDDDGSGAPATFTLQDNAKLTLGTGGLLVTTDGTMQGSGTLTSGGSELFAHVAGPDRVYTIKVPASKSGMALVKSGAGTLVLDADNTYDGDTYINSGVLRIGASGNVATSVVDMDRDGRLDVVLAGRLGGSDGKIGGLSGDGVVTLGTGAILPTQKLEIGGSNRSTTFAGQIVGAGGWRKTGTGSLTLTGASSYTGETIVDDGTLVLSGDAYLSGTSRVKLRQGLKLEVDGAISSHLSRLPSSTPIEIEGGSLDVVFGSGLGRTDITNVELRYTAPETNKVKMVASGGSGVSCQLSCNSGFRVAGATSYLNVGAGTEIYYVSPPAMTSGIVEWQVGDWAIYDGTTWARVAADGSVQPYTSFVETGSSTWSSSSNVNLASGATRDVFGNAQTNSLRFARGSLGSKVVLFGGATMRTNAILSDNGVSSIEGSGTITATNVQDAIEELGVFVNDALTVAVPVTDNGKSVSLIKWGGGALTIGNTNTNTGPTRVQSGLLKYFETGDVPTQEQFADLIVSRGAAVDVNGCPVAVGMLSGAGDVMMGGGGSLNIHQMGSSTFSGDVISGSGEIIQSGSGALTLQGELGYSGPYTVAGGTLVLADGSNLLKGMTDRDIILDGGKIKAGASSNTVQGQTNTPGCSIRLASGGGTIDTNGRDFTWTQVEGPFQLIKTGSGTVTFTSDSSAGGVTIEAGALVVQGTLTVGTGTFELLGGSFTGTLHNSGTITQSGGTTFTGHVVNDGTISGSFSPSGGIENFGTISLPALTTISCLSTGLDNEGMVTLSGGTIGGTGPVVNNASISGRGMISSTGGFTNNGLLSVSGGNVTLSNVGACSSPGNIDVAAGTQLRLTGSSLSVSGALTLSAGVVTGTGSLEIAEGGLLTGRGTVSCAFNNKGTVRPLAGTVNFAPNFANAGLVHVDSGTGLSGGAISNSGVIEGSGSIGNAITNTGTILALGNTLSLGGLVVNDATGIISVPSGGKVLVIGGLSNSAGTINLSGGTFHNNGFVLTNTGQISGYGAIFTGGLTNNGSVTLTGGFSTVNGPVTNSAGHLMRMLYNPALFTGDVINNGTIKLTDTTATFAANFTNNGTYTSDPTTNYFQGSTTNGGLMQGGAGDAFIFQGSFNNTGTYSATGSTTQLNGASNSGNFTHSGGTFTAAGSVTNSGTMAIGGAQSWAAGATLNNNGGSATMSSDAGATLTVNANAGIVQFNTTQHIAALSVSASAQMAADGNRTLYTNDLSVAPSATLDLADNDLVVNSGSFTVIRVLVSAGFGHTSGGIISSTSSGSTILALFDNALVHRTTWNGSSISASAIVGKYTYFGDVNIDGQVTGDDYTLIDSNLGTTPAVGLAWISGDANTDGVVTGDDYTVIDSKLGLGVGSPLTPAAHLSSLHLTAVPEPSCGLIIAGGALLGRRRRHRASMKQ